MQAIVLVLRGGPAGWIGAYGNEWIATPSLDSFAAEAVVFDQHISDCPETEAAHRAWRTGLYQFPPFEGTTNRPSADLLHALNQAGARTVLLRANHPDTDVSGFEAGWSEVIDARPQAEDASPLDELVRRFSQVLETLGTSTPWLLWVEIDRLLPPWEVPQDVFEIYFEDEEDDDEESDEGEDEDEEEVEESSDVEEDQPAPVTVTPWSDPAVGPFDRTDMDAWEWLHSSFAAVVTTLDAEVGLLLDQVREKGLDRTAMVAITSDFGWPMGEHNQIGTYRPWMHEELVHVPLLVRMPGAEGALRRVGSLTQPCDLMPTLLELLGATIPEPVQGQSLMPLLRGEAKEIRPYALSGLRLEDAAGWSLRTPEWAVLLPPEEERKPELFAKPDDRWEMLDLSALHLDWMDHAQEVLRQAVERVNRDGAVEWPELKPPGE